jgi:L,D-transpeptidase catalytic domain
MRSIRVVFGSDRTKLGSLAIYSAITGLIEWGPIPCLGQAWHNSETTENGNTPTGSYLITGKKPANTDALGRVMFGPNPRLKLKGESGNALLRDQAAVGRDALLRIHGGRQDSPGVRILKSTQGCIRVLDHDMLDLLRFIDDSGVVYPIKLEVSQGAVLPTPAVLIDLTQSNDPNDVSP